MKGLRITIAVLMSLTFTFLLCCTILGWENLTATEKKEYTKAEMTENYNSAYSAGQESQQVTIAQLEKSIDIGLAQIADLNKSNSDKANQIINLENSNNTLESENEDLKQQINDLEERLAGTIEYFTVSFYDHSQSTLYKSESIKNGDSVVCSDKYWTITQFSCSNENCTENDIEYSNIKWKMYIKNNVGEYVFFNEVELNSEIVITADTMFIGINSWKYHDCQYA